MFVVSLLVLPAVVAFLTSLVAVPFFIKFCSRVGVTAIDQQKRNKPTLPTSGGLPVACGFFLGIMVFVGLTTFVSGAIDLTLVLAAVLSTLVIAIIGFVDDVYVGKQKQRDISGGLEYRIGLPQWAKPLLVLPAAIPLVAVSAGDSTVLLPLLGSVNFGVFYPLLIVPLAVIFVSNATNMLAGLNGLEAGLGFIASTTLGVFCVVNQRWEAAALSFSSAAATLGFLRYNWTPARMLPGDSLTYFAGGAFVSAVIIGNVERFAIVIFLPWIVEFLLKLRAGFKARSYGDLQPDGTLIAPYRDKIYSLTHIAMKLPYWLGLRKGFTETQATGVLLLGELVLCIAALLFYGSFGYA